MFKMASVTVFVVLLAVMLAMSDASNNFVDNGYGNNLFGSKTSFFWFQSPQQPIQDALNTVVMGNRTCTAIHINLVARHGARYTGADDMRGFTVLQNKLKMSMNNSKYDFIKTWQNTYPFEKDSLLTDLGKSEMRYLGDKYGKELSSLFKAEGLDSVKLAATTRVRTVTSAKAFFEALLRAIKGDSTLSNFTIPSPVIKEKILRLYAFCKKFETLTNSPTFPPEMFKFQAGPEFQGVIRDIEQRLQLQSSLTPNDVKTMYSLCSTELAIHNNSQWCTLQSDSNREVLEYENDIEDYYRRLYGYPIVAKMTCPLVQDIFTDLDAAMHANMNHQKYSPGVFQFGHSDTVVDLYAALGLFRDTQPLRADNFQALRKRKFVNAKVGVFSAHLATILYECQGTSQTDYALKMLVNGDPVAIPACNSDVCWYNDVRNHYRLAVDDCHYDAVCQQDPAAVVG